MSRRQHSVKCESFKGALWPWHRGYPAADVSECDCWCHSRTTADSTPDLPTTEPKQ